jgi:hypothetical protein
MSSIEDFCKAAKSNGVSRFSNNCTTYKHTHENNKCYDKKHNCICTVSTENPKKYEICKVNFKN